MWSPGSTTNSSSSTETTIPQVHQASVQPEPESLSAGFYPVKSSGSTSTVFPHKTETTIDSHHSIPLSPTVTEMTPELTKSQTEFQKFSYDPTVTVAPVHKYWTLPRNIAQATKIQYQIEDEQQGKQPQKNYYRQIISDHPPPPNAKFICETEDAKYFSLPAETVESVTTKKVIPAPPKTEGIGPLDESGIPLTLKSVCFLLSRNVDVLFIKVMFMHSFDSFVNHC